MFKLTIALSHKKLDTEVTSYAQRFVKLDGGFACFQGL
jgi:hypothetical protein